MSARFILRVLGSYYRFTLVAHNDELILTSKAYPDSAAARNGVQAAMGAAAMDGRYDRLSSESGSLFFVLKAFDGGYLATSVMYDSALAREAAIAAAKVNAPDAPFVDLTRYDSPAADGPSLPVPSRGAG